MSTLPVNIPESLRRRAQTLAQDDGVSLDQFIATALAEKVAVLDADTYLRERAAPSTRYSWVLTETMERTATL